MSGRLKSKSTGKKLTKTSKMSSSLPATPAELLCSRCYKRDSCVQCCGTRFCLRHFHTSNHASDHPQKAFVMNQRALDEQLPAFEDMWREAFQSVADDIDRLSHDVEKRVAHDPLASIGMPRPAARKPASSSQAGSASGKGSETSPPGDNNSSSVTKRRREADKEREEQEAAAAAATDPFARRRTRPKSYWAVGNETKSTEAAVSPLAAPATAPMGEYKCESCESLNTSFDVIGGAAVGTRKAETFGKKDAPELILRVVCHACGYNWLEER